MTFLKSFQTFFLLSNYVNNYNFQNKESDKFYIKNELIFIFYFINFFNLFSQKFYINFK